MTRVALGVHWLTDILAGLCLGWAWFAVCFMAVGRRAGAWSGVERGFVAPCPLID